MAAKAGQSASRRTPSAPAAAAAAAGDATTADPRLGPGFEPLRLTPVQPREPQRARIFSVTGDDGAETWYTVNVEPEWRTGIEYAHRIRTEGLGLAIDWLLGEMLGDDGYTALRSCKGLRPEQFSQLVAAVQKIALGPLELPKES